jgi:hypothetical protein
VGRLVVGAYCEALLGDPDGDQTVVEVVRVAFAVVLERLLVLVELPAVALDDDVVVRKEGVDLSAVDVDVDLWGRKVVCGEEGEEVVLEG